MTIKGNPYRIPVQKLIDLLVIREVVSHKQAMDVVHVRHHPGTVYIPAIDSPGLDDAVGVTRGGVAAEGG